MVVKQFTHFKQDTHLGLLASRNEFATLETYVKNGVQGRRSIFEISTRTPLSVSFGMVAGTNRLVETILKISFSDNDLNYLSGFLSMETVDFLSSYSFTGSIRGYREGDVFFPHSPVLTIETTLGEGIVLGTLATSVLNYDCSVATTMLRVKQYTRKPVIDLSTGYVVGEDVPQLVRAAYVGGLDGSTSVEANRLFNIPLHHIMSPEFIVSYPTELEAFRAQYETFGPQTTFLIDTYDLRGGVGNVLEVVSAEKLQAVRVNNSDPFYTRELLDEVGAFNTKIVYDGGYGTVEEFKELASLNPPIDVYGVGGLLKPESLGLSYNLIAVEDDEGFYQPVSYTTGGKIFVGGEKEAYREYDDDWAVKAEHLITVRGHDMVSPEWENHTTVYCQDKGKIFELESLPVVKERAVNNVATKTNPLFCTMVDNVVVFSKNDEEH